LRTDHCWSNFCRIILMTIDGIAMFIIPTDSPIRNSTPMEASDLTRRMNEFYQVASEVLRDVQDITDQQVKHWIVNPFLITLGWDPHDKKQVFLDFPVKSDGGHADYALLDLAGRARLVLEVGGGKETVGKAEEAGRKAKLLGAPLALITNGQEFSLWYIAADEPPTPLFVLPLKELAENAEALLGLTVEYRLSETGINQLRKSAIRLAVLQMLEENSEKTFDAMVNWVQSQVAPGALDDTTESAIRDATMIWLLGATGMMVMAAIVSLSRSTAVGLMAAGVMGGIGGQIEGAVERHVKRPRLVD